MKLINIKPESKGTVRFTVLGKQGLYRKRSMKSRWGFQGGDAFKQIHFGKRTIGLEFKGGRNLFGFAKNAK